MELTERGLLFTPPVESVSGVDDEHVEFHREGLLLYLRARSAAEEDRTSGISPNVQPSLTQELWWTRWQEDCAHDDPGSLGTLIPYSDASIDVVESAIRRSIGRHEALRASFCVNSDKLAVQLNDPSDFFIRAVRADTSVAEPDGGQIARIARRLSRKRLRMDEKWLTAAWIVVGSERSGIIVLVLHHSIGDATSLHILRKEISRALLDGQHGGAIDDTKKANEYRHFVDAERRWFMSETGQPLVDFWHYWISRVPALRVRGGAEPLAWKRGHRLEYLRSFDDHCCRRIQAVAKSHRVSSFIVILSIYALAIGAWSGQKSFALLCVGDSRMLPSYRGFSQSIGMMMHMSPIEINLEKRLCFSQCIQSVDRSFRRGRQLAFPLSLYRLTDRAFIHKIGASINYSRAFDGAAAADGVRPSEAVSDAVSGWQRLTVDDSDIVSALQPINLRMTHMSTGAIIARLEFNSECFDHNGIRQFIDEFDAALQLSGG